MTQTRLHTYTGAITLFVVALALLNWSIMPEQSKSWFAALVTMPVIWIVAGLLMRLSKRMCVDGLEQKFLVSAVVAAGSLLAFSLAAKFIDSQMNVDANLIERAREVFMGLVLLYFANFVPKLIGPSLQGKCSSATANAVRRFSGWVLVIGALGYIAAWLFAPLTHASTIAQWWLGGAVALTFIRIFAALIGGKRA